MMKRIFNAFLTLAMVITAGMTLTSCSVDDNPTTPQNSLAQQLVGEWINEYDYSGTGDILIVTIYHFYGDGTCWKELNLRQGNEVFDQTDSRYATSQSTYTIDASGRVVMTVRDADRGTEETEVLTFDGTHLSVTYVEEPIIMVRATDAQIQFYKAEADAIHGGSDDDGSDDGGSDVGHPLSESAVGEIVGTDGKAYAVADKDYLPTGVSAAAMVAYNNGTIGLAIALTDEPEDMDWSTANGPSGAAAHTPAVAGQTWKLPSLEEFRQMFIGTDGDALLSWVMNRNLNRAGGTPLKASLQDNAGYWMSSEWEGDVASHMRHFDNHVGYNRMSKDIVSSVRACFAFNAKARALSESAVGDIVGTDGMAYYVADKDNLPEGVSAAAMVTYRKGTHGLAIALADEPDKMNWDTAMGETGAKAHTPAVSGQTWRLPTVDEWMQMLGGFGDDVTHFKYWKSEPSVKFNAALKAAGGELGANQYYWSSGMDNAFWAVYNKNGSFLFGGLDKDSEHAVRACFAF